MRRLPWRCREVPRTLVAQTVEQGMDQQPPPTGGMGKNSRTLREKILLFQLGRTEH